MRRLHQSVAEVQYMLGAAYNAFLGILRPLQAARGSVTSRCVLSDLIVIGMELGKFADLISGSTSKSRTTVRFPSQCVAIRTARFPILLLITF